MSTARSPRQSLAARCSARPLPITISSYSRYGMPNSRLPHIPGSAITCDESLRGLGSPRASRVERQVLGPWRFPVCHHRVDKRPGLVDPIRARKERLIALHGIVKQPFVGTRRVGNAKGQIITKMHGDRTQADVWSRLFGQKGVHNTL